MLKTKCKIRSMYYYKYLYSCTKYNSQEQRRTYVHIQYWKVFFVKKFFFENLEIFTLHATLPESKFCIMLLDCLCLCQWLYLHLRVFPLDSFWIRIKKGKRILFFSSNLIERNKHIFARYNFFSYMHFPLGNRYLRVKEILIQ